MEGPIAGYIIKSKKGLYLTRHLYWHLTPIENAHVFSPLETQEIIKRSLSEDWKTIVYSILPAVSIDGTIVASSGETTVASMIPSCL